MFYSPHVTETMNELKEGAEKHISLSAVIADLEAAFPQELRAKVLKLSQPSRVDGQAVYGFGNSGNPVADANFHKVLQYVVEDFDLLFSPENQSDDFVYTYETYVRLMNDISDAVSYVIPIED